MLIHNAGDVLKRAWSVRLIALSALLTGAEVYFSLISPGTLGVSPGAFAVLSAFTSTAAFAARFIIQRSKDA